jgi:hypothetical protein
MLSSQVTSHKSYISFPFMIFFFQFLFMQNQSSGGSLCHLFFFFLRIGGDFSVEVGSLLRFSDRIFGDAVGSMLVGL